MKNKKGGFNLLFYLLSFTKQLSVINNRPLMNQLLRNEQLSVTLIKKHRDNLHMKKHPTNISGFTLIELMITVAVIGVISAIAIPTYHGYIKSSCNSVGAWNMEQLEWYVQNYYLENRTYVGTNGTHNPGDTSSNLMTALHWKPNDDDRFKYEISGATANQYTLTVSGAGATTSGAACPDVNFTKTVTPN